MNKIVKNPANMNNIKRTSTKHLDTSPTIVGFSSTSHPQNVSLHEKTSSHKQNKNKKKWSKQHPSQANGLKYGATTDMKSSDNKKLNGKARLEQLAVVKLYVKKTAESQMETQLSKKITLPALKKTQCPINKKDEKPSISDTTSSTVKKDESADKKHQKRKANSKKKHDGTSNWKQLCATLNIDASVRKSKPIKRPAPDDSTTQAEPKRSKSGVWFDNVDKILIEADTSENKTISTHGSSEVDRTKAAEHDTCDKLVRPDSFKGLTTCVAMDCEMVGVGPQGEESILARVSIVNHFGVCLYDKFVLPREKVTDYRTYVSGVTAENLATGEEFTKVQSEVSDLLKGRILVGHAVHNDLKVLFLTHPHKMIRDTSLYKPFRAHFAGRLPSLKKLTEKVLGVHVQEGQHSSVQDAQATMRLYTMHRQKWEKELRKDRKTDRKKKKKLNKKEQIG